MAEDIDRLMKHAHRIEREGKKEIAEVVYTAASEIARMRGEMTWQPIDTAPKDGRAILIFQGDKAPHGFSWNFDDERYAIGYWRTDGRDSWGNRNDAFVTPTYWMPLPGAPNAQGERSSQEQVREKD